MNKYYILTLLFLQFACANANIIINGNNITKDYVILDIINQGHLLDYNQKYEIAKVENDLLALDIFEDVFIELQDSLYIINITEKPKVITFPLIDRNESLGWSYGIKLHLNNIKGENKKLKFNVATGAIGSGSISYEQPSFKNNHQLSGEVFKRNRTDIEENYLLEESQLNIIYKIPNNTTSTLIFNLSYLNNNLKFYNTNNFINYYGSALSLEYSNSYLQKTYKNNFNAKIIFYDFNNFNTYQYLDLVNSFTYSINDLKNISLLIRNQLSIYSTINIPIYQQLYIGGEEGVRSYEQNPSLNDIEIQNQLVTNNAFFTTLQLQLPFYETSWIKSQLLFFIDYGVGADYYKSFNMNNKISGKGFGLRFNIAEQGDIDMCIGTNKYGKKILHFIVNI